MGPKKGRMVRKIEVPTNTPTEFELEIQLLIYRGGGMRGRSRKRHRNIQRKPGGRKKRHTQQRRESPKSVQGQTEATQKWTWKVQERHAHLNRTRGKRRGT